MSHQGGRNSATPAATTPRPWRVAIVDDNPDDRAEVRQSLLQGAERRYSWVEAETGAAAIRAVLDPAAGAPDCVILDYFLPDMDAIKVLEALAGPGGLAICPVVVLTGRAGHEHARALMRAGAQDYIGKDWMTAESLTRSVENAVERWEMVRELAAKEEALRSSERRFRGIFDATFQFTGLLDPEGRILEANRSAMESVGVAAEEVVGRPIWETPWCFHYPEERERVRDGCLRAATGEFVRFEVRYRSPDGTEAVVDFSITPVRDERGEVVLLVPEARDITERKRAEEALKKYAGRLEDLRAIDLDILSARSTGEIASAALLGLAGRVPCWTGGVAAYDPEREEMRAIVGFGAIARSYPPEARLPHTIWGNVERGSPKWGKMVVERDIAGTIQVCPVLEKLRAAGLRSYVLIPLICEGSLIGSILLGSERPSAFEAEAIEIARDVADRLAIAIRQAGLHDELVSARARLEALSRQLIRAQEVAMRRIARELHDEVGQSLAAIKITLSLLVRDPSGPELVQRLAEAAAMTGEALKQVRDVSRLLRPSLLDDLGLADALRALVTGLADRVGLGAEVDIQEIGRVGPDAEITCYRIAQESLTNAIKHANARRMRVALRGLGDELELIVEDDGVGFEVAAAEERAAGGASLGILGMHERAAMAGGRVEILSRPGQGTRVRVVIPAERPAGGIPAAS